MILHTAGLIVLKNKKLLLAYSANKKAWYLPGGKLDAGESAVEALVREIYEELLLRIAPQELDYYTHITAPAFGENSLTMEQDCFRYELNAEIKPTHEILAIKYFDLENYRLEQEQVPGVLLLFEKLQADQLI